MHDINVLDGGFSTQLSTHVDNKIDGDPLWTARFLLTNPEAVFKTHLDFLRGGADIIQTNTYQASVGGFVKYFGLSEEDSYNLMRDAVSHAKRAVEAYRKEMESSEYVHRKKPLIAGSCGPYVASLHNGAEYTGVDNKIAPPEVLMDWHKPRIKALLDGGVDILALETIPWKYEAEFLVQLLREFPDAKAWLSFSCRTDGKSIVDGCNFQKVAMDCFKRAIPGQILAIGVNCIQPQYTIPLLEGINKIGSNDFIPLVLYPNSGETYTKKEGWKKESDCDGLEQFVKDWLDIGVRYIGGCCRTTANDIRKIRAEVDQWKAAKDIM